MKRFQCLLFVFIVITFCLGICFATAEEIGIGDIVTFGCYEQDNCPENGKEPIEWQVLDTINGRALLISKYVLGYQCYDGTGYEWKDCSLRRWLNFDFYISGLRKKRAR